MIAYKLAVSFWRDGNSYGLRSLGPEQLMACYPGSFEGTLQQRVAAGIVWLISRLHPQHLVIDRHNSIPHDPPGANRYAGVGLHTTPAALAAAYLMDQSIVQFAGWSKFRRAVPRSVFVDESPHGMQRSSYGSHDLAIEEIAHRGPAGLTELYYQEDLGEQLNYYESVLDVVLADPRTGEPNQAVLGVLPQLEENAVQGHSAEGIDLSDKTLQALGLEPGRYVAFFGGYHNHSGLIDNGQFGLPEDRERRLCWGEIAREARGPRPLPGTDFVTFDHNS